MKSLATTTTASQNPHVQPRVAVIGCGYWGRNLVRNFAELGALAAVVDADAAIAQELADKHDAKVMTLEAVMADPSIRAIAIAAPAVLHIPLARQGLEAGKHVFVEKPVALDVTEAEALCQLAERLDRRLMVGHLLQYHPAFIRLRELALEGRLGRVQHIFSDRLSLGKIRREEDVLWSFAPHDLSMVLSLVGAEPDRVEATGGYHLGDDIADIATMHLTFPGGQRAQISVSWLHPFKQQKVTVVGSEGMAVFDDTAEWGKKLVFHPNKIVWKNNAPEPVRGEAEAISVPLAEPLKQECRHFLDCVRDGATPRTDGREGLRVLRVLSRASAAMEAGRASGAMEATGRPVTPPPAPKPRVAGNHPGVMIHESAYVDERVHLGEGTRIWHFSHILGDVRIGKKASIGQNVVIGPRVTIGDNAKIQNNVSVYEGVTLEDNVFCGPSCVFTNVNNPRSEIIRKDEFRQTLVRSGATIGANATIVCGATLGEYSFIAAGAVVAGDVPAFALMAGVPARRIGWMSRAGGKLGADLVCPLTGVRYRETGAGTLEELAR